MKLEVAEACSGIRSLMSLFTLAVFYGYFLEKSFLRRVVLALASIPIAIAANAVRILGTGLCVQYWDPDKALGFFHEFSGWVMFLVSLGCLFMSIASCACFRPKGGRYEEPSFLDSCPAAGCYGAVAACAAAISIGFPPASLCRRFRAPLPDGREPMCRSTRIRSMFSGPEISSRGSTLRTGSRSQSACLSAISPRRGPGVTIHSPKNCLPGAGWAFESSHYVDLNDANGKPHRVGEYIIANGETAAVRHLLVSGAWAQRRQ